MTRIARPGCSRPPPSWKAWSWNSSWEKSSTKKHPTVVRSAPLSPRKATLSSQSKPQRRKAKRAPSKLSTYLECKIWNNLRWTQLNHFFLNSGLLENSKETKSSKPANVLAQTLSASRPSNAKARNEFIDFLLVFCQKLPMELMFYFCCEFEINSANSIQKDSLYFQFISLKHASYQIL